MKYWLLFVLLLVLSACASPSSATPQPTKADYPDLGAAPELTGDTWLNTSGPLRLADLRGKVILLEMWTFG